MLSLSGQFANVADEVLRKTTKDFTSEMRAVREPNFHGVCTDAVLQLQEAAQHATEYDGEAPAPAGDDTEAEDDSLRSLLDHFESKVACTNFCFRLFRHCSFFTQMQGMGGVPLDPETLKLWQDTLEVPRNTPTVWF
jgi:hypothetical protein